MTEAAGTGDESAGADGETTGEPAGEPAGTNIVRGVAIANRAAARKIAVIGDFFIY